MKKTLSALISIMMSLCIMCSCTTTGNGNDTGTGTVITTTAALPDESTAEAPETTGVTDRADADRYLCV